MNTTDTQHAGKTPSGAVFSPEQSQFLQSALAMATAHGESAPSGPPALSSTPTMSALVQALRRRWLLGVGLACLAAVLLVLGVFTFMPPKYQVSIRLRVAARVPGADDIEFPIFKANMEALVKSPLVLNNALNDKTSDGREIKDLPLVRSKGLGVIEWLEKSLKTDFNLGPEVLRVALAADQPDEAAELLNAISRAFQFEYAEMERSKKQQRLAELRHKKERIEDDLEVLRKQLDRILREVPVKDREVQVQTLLNRRAGVESSRRANEDAIAKAEGKIATVKARLSTIDKAPIPEKALFDVFAQALELQGINKRIADLQDQINRIHGEYNEPFASQRSQPLKSEMDAARKQKLFQEAQLKPAVEERWRLQTREELKDQLLIAGEEKIELERVKERISKEIVELDIAIAKIGAGAGDPPGVIAIKDKIEVTKTALNKTGERISEVELEVPGSRLHLLQLASAPQSKDRSQQTKIAGAGGVGVFIMALFGVAFLEFRSRRINMVEEVAQGLGMKVVGTIPASPPRPKKPDPAAEHAWQAQLQESVDAIRTVLMHQARTDALHVLMVTSASTGEGKTTLATQLAASLSRAWKRVLVVDGDLRHSAAHKLFDVPQEPGLAEVLRGEVEASDAVRATALSRLWVLPAGNGDQHAIQALAQDNVRTLFEQLKQQYDFIIVDTPPVLPVTDSLLLGQHVDGVLFAVLKDISRAPAIYAAQQKLAPLEVRTLGAVVLGIDASGSDNTYGFALSQAAKS